MPEHLGRTLSAMADAGVDALVLGRSGNVRFVSGAEQLSLAGTRPFAPACVVVRSTGRVHLMSTTDAGVPPEIPTEQLYPMSWNPMTIASHVAAVRGLADAEVIGVDGLTPMMESLLGSALPRARLVDGESLLRAVRRAKSTTDLDGIRRAVTVAETCVGAVADAIHAGRTERALQGAFTTRMGRLGVATPAFDPMTCVAGTAVRAIATDRALRTGDLVHVRGGVIVDGWEGLLARTRVVGAPSGPQTAAAERASAALGDVIAACRTGAVIGEVRGRHEVVCLDGVGLGHEDLADDDTLRASDVLYVEVLVDQVLVGDMIVVGDGEPQILTTSPLAIA